MAARTSTSAMRCSTPIASSTTTTANRRTFTGSWLSITPSAGRSTSRACSTPKRTRCSSSFRRNSWGRDPIRRAGYANVPNPNQRKGDFSYYPNSQGNFISNSLRNPLGGANAGLFTPWSGEASGVPYDGRQNFAQLPQQLRCTIAEVGLGDAGSPTPAEPVQRGLGNQRRERVERKGRGRGGFESDQPDQLPGLDYLATNRPGNRQHRRAGRPRHKPTTTRATTTGATTARSAGATM